MKYSFGVAPDSHVIKNYKVFLNTIIVTFLDNTTCPIPYSKENEQKIINLMVEQAKKRNQPKTLKDLKSESRWNAAVAVTSAVISVLGAAAVPYAGMDNAWLLLPIGAMCVTFYFSATTLLQKEREIDEFKKYAKYLALLENNEELDSSVNINTLDEINLVDIKVKSKVQRRQMYNA